MQSMRWLAAVGLAALAAAPGAGGQTGVGAAVGECPVWSVEIDVRPMPGPARGTFRVVGALRDPRGGARIESVEFDVAPGQESRSSRTVPGGLGEFSLQLSLTGDGRTVEYLAELTRDGVVQLSQRARVELER